MTTYSSGTIEEIKTTVAPTDGQAGYMTGCVRTNTNGASGSVVFINEGIGSLRGGIRACEI